MLLFTKRKKSYILNFALIFIMGTLLCGCSSNSTETTAPVDNAVVEEEMMETSESTEEAEETTSVEEPVVEEAIVEEPAIEETKLYIPEGIDMESTLTGEEWLASFVGKVQEPVVVIINDNTGRKEVVQANSEVTVNPDEDRIAVYWNEIGMGYETHSISRNGTKASEYYDILTMDSEKMRDIPEREAKVDVTGGASEWSIEFTIIVE